MKYMHPGIQSESDRVAEGKPGPVPSSLSAVAGIAAGLVMVMSLIVLWGWTIDDIRIERLRREYPAMNPTTATCFLMTGLSLLISAVGPGQSMIRKAGTGLAIITAAAAFARFVDCAGNFGLRVDGRLFSQTLALEVHQNDRMAQSTAFLFIILSLSLMMGGGSSRFRETTARLFAGLTFLIALLLVSGYVLHVAGKIGISSDNPLAMHTAMGFLTMGIGSLALHYR